MNSILEYHELIKEKGLFGAWETILTDYFPSEFFSSEHLGGLYEDGLAFVNKIEKKSMGKYYTPIDVAEVMSAFLLELEGESICDLCCGTGNLIIAALSLMPNEEVVQKFNNGQIYLYDIDPIALMICKAILTDKYGSCVNKGHFICEDCLSASVHFPDGSKIISNPPYGKMNELVNSPYLCAKTTKEMYVAFMEKIIAEKRPAVIITPHSFLGGSTFKTLRKELLSMGGAIYSFDNVPANIFKGKKYGIFNSNEVNSTRAAITVLEPQKQGYAIAPFIRFKTDERNEVLNTTFLQSLLPNYKQQSCEMFYRVEPGTEKLIQEWTASKLTLNSLLSPKSTEYRLDVPNTCRYFTTAAKRSLSRKGKITLYFKDEISWYLGYAFINSSFCYYWHRTCNGGITYPITLLKNMPIFGEATQEIVEYCKKLMEQEEEYIVLKKNAGEYQENIKFPMSVHNELNIMLLKQLGVECSTLLNVHSNSCFNKDFSDEE